MPDNFSHPNKFHGNISEDMTLSNVFEQIALSQRHGWLFLRYTRQEICLYFQGDLVGIVNPPEDKLQYIPEKLFHSGILPPQAYEQIASSEDPLEALEKMVDPEEITSVLNTICYDEICALFFRSEGYFEFVDQNHPEANPELKPIGAFV